MIRPGYYILDADGQAKRIDDVIEWSQWMEHAHRDRSCVVQQDYAEGSADTVGVSTVFLGLDHNFSDNGPPVLWETMVFGTTLDGEQRRYASRAAALAGHADLLQQVSDAWRREQEKTP